MVSTSVRPGSVHPGLATRPLLARHAEESLTDARRVPRGMGAWGSMRATRDRGVELSVSSGSPERRIAEAGRGVAHLIVSGDEPAALDLLSEACEGPEPFESCVRVLEPAALALGDLWGRDECTGFALTLALVRLQTDFRRMCVRWPVVPFALEPGSSVLVVPLPGEVHGLGAALASEALWRAGHDVDVGFPSTDAALQEEVAATRFDAVHLALSPAVSRQGWLGRLATTVTELRSASSNAGLRVFVGGRVFGDQRGAVRSVGADGGTDTALDLDGMVREPAAREAQAQAC